MMSTPTLNAHADATGAAALRSHAEQLLDESMPDLDDLRAYLPDKTHVRDEGEVLEALERLAGDICREFRTSVAGLADRLERGTLLRG